MDKIQIAAIVAALVFIVIIARFVLKGKMRTEYSIIWIFMGILLTVFAFWRESLDLLAEFFQVHYAPSLVFMFFFFMIFIFLIHLSVVNSKQHEQIKKLTQEIALMKEREEAREKKEDKI
jgi:hypothetical protein